MPFVKSYYLLVFILCSLLLMVWPNNRAYACCGCRPGDCGSAIGKINGYHAAIVTNTSNEFSEDLSAFEDWVIDELYQRHILPAMRMFTTQMNSVAMQQVQIIGMFIDAKTQMATQRVFQELQAEAHRDYIPSDDFCWFGTNIRSMPATMTKARYNAMALASKSLDRQLGNLNSKSAGGVNSDMQSRWKYFRQRYCDPSDNNRSPIRLAGLSDRAGTGLEMACDYDGPSGSSDMGAEESLRTNLDIDYTRLIDLPRTLDIDFADNNAASDNEQDVIAMSENLYGHRVLSRDLNDQKLRTQAGRNMYFALRSVAAKRSVAENTFNALVGLKSAGTIDQFKEYVESATGSFLGSSGGALTAPLSAGHTRQYLAAIVRDLYPFSGLTPDMGGQKVSDWDVYNLIGQDPSYYSQLEIMAKKMYQNPDFYIKLYDTPANVIRKNVSMKAIELIIDREMYESQLRREMAVSVLLSTKLRALERKVSEGLINSTAVGKR